MVKVFLLWILNYETTKWNYQVGLDCIRCFLGSVDWYINMVEYISMDITKCPWPCPVCNRDIDPPNEEGEMCWQCYDLLYNDRDYEEAVFGDHNIPDDEDK